MISRSDMRLSLLMTSVAVMFSASAAIASGPGSTGGAHYSVEFPPVAQGHEAHAAFWVAATAAGADGKAEVRVVDASGELVQRFHGTVDCYFRQENRAVLTGEVTHLELGTNTNTGRFFRISVEDNGEGSAMTEPDRIDHRRREEPFDCTATPVARPLNAVAGGNVRVHR